MSGSWIATAASLGAATLTLAVGGAGCSSPGDRLALPEVAGTRAIVWGVSGSGGAAWFAIDREAGFEPEALAVARDDDAEAEVVALVYPETLSSLGLSAGPLPAAPDGQPLPMTGQLFTRTVGPTGYTPWATPAAPPSFVTEARVARRSPCGTLQVEARRAFGPERSSTQAVIRAPEGRLLLAVGASPRAPAEVLELTGTELGRSLGVLPFARVEAWDPPWVVGTTTTGSTALRRVESSGMLGAAISPPPATPRAIAVVERGGGVAAAYALVDGGLERWDGAAWSRVFALTAPAVDGTVSTLRAASADEAWFLAREGPRLGWYRRDERCDGGAGACTFEIPRADGARASALHLHPELGPIVSTSDGRLLVLDPWPATAASALIQLTTVPDFRSASALLPFPGGFLLGGAESGLLAEYQVGSGMCPHTNVSGLSVYHLILDGDALLVLGNGAGADPQPGVHVVRWERP